MIDSLLYLDLSKPSELLRNRGIFLKYIAHIGIPKEKMEKYLEFGKKSVPDYIKVILPPQFLGNPEKNFSGVMVFESKRWDDLVGFLRKFELAGFIISLSPIWDNTEILKILDKYRKGKEKAEAEWDVTTLPKMELESTNSLEIMPLIDMKTDLPEMKVEPGVSYLVKTDEVNILFDMGLNREAKHPSPLLNNMEQLGLSLKDIDVIIISHNHGDHVGGSEWADKKTFSLSKTQLDLKQIKVYTPISMTYPGLEPFNSSDPTIIGKGLATTGVISNQLFFLGWTSEQALAVNVREKGIVLIVGCGHQTLPKLLHRTEELFNEPLYGLVGGFHFPVEGGPINLFGFHPHQIFGIEKEPWNPISKEELQEQIALLKQYKLNLLALSPHDSSETSIQMLQDAFPTIFREIKIGQPIRISSG